MNGYKIGELIRYERENKKISRGKLSEGLCTGQMLSKIEAGKCDTDKLLVDMLFQRLGKSSDKLEIIMSRKEYEKIKARDMIEELIWKKKIGKAEYLMDKYFSVVDSSVTIQEMYRYRTKAYMLVFIGGDLVKAMEYIEKAITITVPGWKGKELSKCLISTYEMENMILYGFILSKLEKEEGAQKHIDKCYCYIKEHITDTEEYGKIYPKCVWAISKIYQKEKYDEWVISICEEAIEVLRKGAISHFMVPLLEELIHRCKRVKNKEKIKHWKKYLDILNELYDKYAPNMDKQALFFNPYQCEYSLDYEIIRGERIARGYTQEQLIEGIYQSAEPLSRIENGKEAPSKNKLEAMMEKYNINKGRYNTFIATNSFEILDIKCRLDMLLAVHNIEKAEEVLNELEASLDLKIADNRRFILNIRNTVERIKGNISEREAMSIANSLLKETYDLKKDNNRPPLRNEAIIITQICTLMDNVGETEEAANILKRVLLVYDKSKIDNKYRTRSYMLVYTIYERHMYALKCYMHSMELAKKRISKEIKAGKGGLLESGVLLIGYNKFAINGNVLELQEQLKKAYYLGELYLKKANCENINKAYEKKYGYPIR